MLATSTQQASRAALVSGDAENASSTSPSAAATTCVLPAARVLASSTNASSLSFSSWKGHGGTTRTPVHTSPRTPHRPRTPRCCAPTRRGRRTPTRRTGRRESRRRRPPGTPHDKRRPNSPTHHHPSPSAESKDVKIGDIADDSAIAFDPIAQGERRVVQGYCVPHHQIPDLERSLDQLVIGDPRGRAGPGRQGSTGSSSDRQAVGRAIRQASRPVHVPPATVRRAARRTAGPGCGPSGCARGESIRTGVNAGS